MADTILALTESGQALKAKIEQGNGTIPLKITRIVSGSGTSTNPTGLTALVSPEMEFGITSSSTEGARTTIEAILTNVGDPGQGKPPLAVGYPMSQVGFYALDPDKGEILYRISQYGKPIYVPPASEYGWTYAPAFNIITGNASTVIVEISMDGYAPMSTLAAHIEDPVMSEDGVHGLRFHGDFLQAWDGEGWQETLNPATSTAEGGLKLASDTVQTVTPAAVTATASRTYGIQKNADGQGVVNVPWANTTYTAMSQAEATTGTATTSRTITAKVLADTIAAKGGGGNVFAFSGSLSLEVPWMKLEPDPCWTKEVAVTGIVGAGKPPIVDVVLSPTWATAVTQADQWGRIKRIAYEDNRLTFYVDEQAIPTVALDFTGVQLT
jgi:hypothetical protein